MDLFGHPDAPVKTDIERKREQRRLRERPKGYAATPGSGPAGETCGTCAHCWRSNSGTRGYHKCKLIRPTRGYGTDILKRSPACSRWEALSDS